MEAIPQKLAEAERKLETVQGQLKNAMEEVKKPFPKEEKLNQKQDVKEDAVRTTEASIG